MLQKFSSLTDHPYAFFRAQANSDLPLTASYIAKALNKIWWTNPTFEGSRHQFEDECVSESSALKIEISKYLAEATSERCIPTAYEDETKALSEVVIDGIITTNWDTFAERLFPTFNVYIGQEQLLFGAPQGIAEIYKIHGCCTHPNSLILTKEDYENFHKKNPYLAAKLLTTFIENPVVFLGYSISDQNITSIISAITGCLESHDIPKLQDRLIFVQWDKSATKGTFEGGTITQNNLTIPVKVAKTSSFLPIFRAMTGTKRRFPAQLLRRPKDQVYDLVLHNDPNEKMFVSNIEDAKTKNDIEVVFRVGTISILQARGYKSISRQDITRDIIYDDLKCDYEKLLKLSIEDALSEAKYVPVFKFLYLAGRIAKNGKIDLTGLGPRLKIAAQRNAEFFHSGKYYRKTFDKIFSPNDNIDQIIEKRPKDGLTLFTLFLCPDHIDKKYLRDRISELLDSTEMKSATKSNVSRLICFYDWVCYRNIHNEVTEKEAINEPIDAL